MTISPETRKTSQDLPGAVNPVDQLFYSTHFVVKLGDLRPNPSGVPTDITIFPIQLVKDIPDIVHVRLVAPHQYQWKFAPSEFLYESLASGVPPEQAVPGAELDFPLSLVPPMPIVKPRNELRMDYMRGGSFLCETWFLGRNYICWKLSWGFCCCLRIR